MPAGRGVATSACGGDTEGTLSAALWLMPQFPRPPGPPEAQAPPGGAGGRAAGPLVEGSSLDPSPAPTLRMRFPMSLVLRDWLHLYCACPVASSPLIVFTHSFLFKLLSCWLLIFNYCCVLFLPNWPGPAEAPCAGAAAGSLWGPKASPLLPRSAPGSQPHPRGRTPGSWDRAGSGSARYRL